MAWLLPLPQKNPNPKTSHNRSSTHTKPDSEAPRPSLTSETSLKRESGRLLSLEDPFKLYLIQMGRCRNRYNGEWSECFHRNLLALEKILRRLAENSQTACSTQQIMDCSWEANSISRCTQLISLKTITSSIRSIAEGPLLTLRMKAKVSAVALFRLI